MAWVILIVVVVFGGFALRALVRARWASFEAEQARRRETVSHERSPFPFIHDEQWRRWRARLGDDVGRGGHSLAMELVVVPEAVKARVTPRPIDGPSPEPRTLEGCARELATFTSQSSPIHAGEWPVCCERLSTLLSTDELTALEARLGPLDECAVGDGRETWAESCRRWREDHRAGLDGAGFFQCRGCGRPYVAFHEP